MKPEITTVKLALLTVLVVDDDKVVREIIINHLRNMGFARILEAPNGSEAFKVILDVRQRVDLILCDWEMPKTDGLTFLKAVRQQRTRSEIPFIMITSQQSQERMKISKAKKSKVDAYIVKPFKAETLREKIFQVLFDSYEKKSEAG